MLRHPPKLLRAFRTILTGNKNDNMETNVDTPRHIRYPPFLVVMRVCPLGESAPSTRRHTEHVVPLPAVHSMGMHA